jgi:hypothetical protein
MKADAVVQVYAGQGTISFPQGGRIQSRFELTEYATGKRRLRCTGEFPQASYRGWEHLVHQYRLDASLPRRKAEATGLVQSYSGFTVDNQPITITQMLLIDADAQGVTQGNLRLRMDFDCTDAEIQGITLYQVPEEEAEPEAADDVA